MWSCRCVLSGMPRDAVMLITNSMRDPHLARLLVHVIAIVAAVACWQLLADFALALGASLLVFLAINAVGHIAFGPMPTAEELRRDVQRILNDRE